MSESDKNDSRLDEHCERPPRWHQPIRGVALDMDGLLFDTERLYWQVGDEVLRRRGYRFCTELQQRMMGRVALAAMQEMIDFHSLADSPEALLAESDQLYGELLEGGEAKEMPGVRPWLDFLVSAEIPFGLATSSRRIFVDILLRHVEWKDSLAFQLTGDDVTRGKPDPEIYLSAAQRLGCPPEQTLVLEDSANGCLAAVRAGACTVAVPSEHTLGHDFSNVHMVARSLTDPRLWDLIRST